MHLFFRLAALGAAAAFLWPRPAGASASFSVSPARIEFQAPPGGEDTGTARVRNLGPHPLSFTVTTGDWMPDPQGRPEFHPPGTVRFGAGGWLEVEPRSFTLDPEESREVRIKVTVPGGEPGGGYQGAVFFSARAGEPAGEEGKVLHVQGRIAILVYVTVGSAEDLVVEGRAGPIETYPSSRLVLSYPLTFRVPFENRGNVHLTVGGEVEVRSWNGRSYGRVTLEPRVVPRNSRIFLTGTFWGPPLGYLEPEGKVRFGDRTQRVSGSSLVALTWPTILALGLILAGALVLAGARDRRR